MEKQLHGTLDKISFWNIVLSEQQIKEMMFISLSGNENGLEAYWPFNEGFGWNSADLSNNEHNAVLAYQYFFTGNEETPPSWVESTAPVGQGICQTFSGDFLEWADIEDTGVTIKLSQPAQYSPTVSKINNTPNISPTTSDTIFNQQYWIILSGEPIEKSVDIRFTVEENIEPDDETFPKKFKLYSRDINSHSTWRFVTFASLVSADKKVITFQDVPESGQFIITKGNAPVIANIGQHQYMETSQQLTISNILIKDINGGSLTVSAQTQDDTLIPNENIFVNHTMSSSSILTAADEYTPLSITIQPDVRYGNAVVTLSVSNSKGLVSSVNLDFHVQKDAMSEAGGSLLFDGFYVDDNFGEPDSKDSCVSIFNEAPFDFTNTMTIEIWFRINEFSVAWQPIITKGADSWSIIRYESSNMLCFTTHGLSNLHLPGATSVNDGKWHHLAVVFDGQTKCLYLDGVLDAKVEVSGDIQTNDNQVYIGSYHNIMGKYFNGEIDEVRIWNIARTKNNIHENIHTTLAGNEPGLIAYYQFNETGGDTVYDVSGNYNNGELKDTYSPNGLDLPERKISPVPISKGEVFSGFMDNDVSGLWGDTSSKLVFDVKSVTGENIEIVTTLCHTPPDLLPIGKLDVILDYYWIVRKFGEGSIHSDMTFMIPDQISESDTAEQFKLFWRPANSIDNWELLTSATQINRDNPNITFSSIENQGQFIIAKTISSIDLSAGNAVILDGVDDYISIDKEEDFDFLTSMTIEAWIKLENIHSTKATIISKNSKAWSLSIDPDSHAIIFKTGYKEYSIFYKTNTLTGNQDLLDDKWHHIAAVYNGSNKYIYIDGELDATNSAKTLTTNDKPLVLGAYYDKDTEIRDFFQGAMDEIRVWGLARTQSEIRENMHLCLKGDELGLVAYWQFDEQTGVISGDQTGKDHIATLIDYASENEDFLTPPSRIPSTAPVINTPDNTKNGVVREIPQNFTGNIDFADVNALMTVNTIADNSHTVIIHLMEQLPNTFPQGLETVFDNQFWLLNNFGEGDLDFDIVFTPRETLNLFTSEQLSKCRLYYRSSTDDKQWTLMSTVDSFDLDLNTLTFKNINQFGQFIIGIVDPEFISVAITEPQDDEILNELKQIKGHAFANSTLSHIKLQITDGNTYVNESSMFTSEPSWLMADGTDNWFVNTSLVNWSEGVYYTIVVMAYDASENTSQTKMIFGYKVKKENTITCTMERHTITLGEVIHISGQISPAPGKPVSVWLKLISPNNIENPPQDFNANSLGFFEGYLDCEIFNVAGAWSLQTSWDGSLSMKPSESLTEILHVNKSGTQMTIDLASKSIKIKEPVFITGQLLPKQRCNHQFENLPVVISFLSESSLITQTVYTNSEGVYEIDGFNGLNLLGDWSIQAAFSGNDSYSNCISNQVNADVVNTAGYAIVVQGSIESLEGQTAYNKTTKKVIAQLKENGLLENDINYLQPDNDGVINKSAIQDAITNWAVEKMNAIPGNLYIVMVDHGSENIFYVYPSTISDTELSSWLDNLQSQLSNASKDQKIVVIMGFCHSGSFIDQVSGPKRVIITSAASNELSFKGPMDMGVRDGEYFISEFFKQSQKGKSIKWCFNEAVKQTEIFTQSKNKIISAPFYDFALQHPLLDDNGDGLGSNDLSNFQEEGQLSDTFSIGFRTNTTEIDILSSTQTLFLNENQSMVDFRIQLTHTDMIDRLWIGIKSPQFQSGLSNNTAQPDMPLLTFDYDQTDQNYYIWNDINIFDDAGTYEILYFVRYVETGIVSILKKATVYKALSNNNPPNQFALIEEQDNDTISPTIPVGKDDSHLIMSWEPAHDPNGDPVTYSVFLSDTIAFHYTGTITIENLTEEMQLIGIPNKWVVNDGAVYWKVKAIDSYGAFCESAIQKFYTKDGNPAIGWIKGKVMDLKTMDLILTAQVKVNQRTFRVAGGYYMGKTAPCTFNLNAQAPGYETMSFSGITITDGELLKKIFTWYQNNI